MKYSTTECELKGKWFMNSSLFVCKPSPGTDARCFHFFLHCYLLFIVCNYKQTSHMRPSVFQDFFVLKPNIRGQQTRLNWLKKAGNQVLFHWMEQSFSSNPTCTTAAPRLCLTTVGRSLNDQQHRCLPSHLMWLLGKKSTCKNVCTAWLWKSPCSRCDPQKHPDSCASHHLPVNLINKRAHAPTRVTCCKTSLAIQIFSSSLQRRQLLLQI